MGFRTIKYGSIQDGGASGGEVFTDVSTFGELKAKEEKIGLLSSGGMSAVAKPEGGGASVKLTSDSTNLPEGAFSLWFVTNKNDSGNGNA